ncbi:MAG: hypothetical protein WB542_14360 [Polaromonas sp.]
MTSQASSSRSATGWTSQRTVWLLFAPPAVMAGLRWVLQSVSDRQVATPAPPLLPVSTTTGPLDLLWPAALVLAVLVAAGLLIRRTGWRRVMPALGAAWVLLWLAGSGALLQRQLNRQGLFLQGMTASEPAPVNARVLASKFKPPSLRGMGGTELVLQVSGLEVPQRLVIDDPQAAPLKPGDRLALQYVHGRFSGLFVTGWQAASPAVSPLIGTP